MIAILIALFSVGLPLLIAHLLHKHTKTAREITRKVAHMGSGIAIAVAPFYLPWETVRYLAVALFIIVALALRFGWGRSFYSVRRKTYGEILFPLAVIGVSIFAPSPAVFCVAILHLAVADGLAAIFGTLYGKKSEYKIMGYRKSWVGTTAFFIASMVLLVSFNVWALEPIPWGMIAVLPFVATLFENIGVRGADNITVPMVIVLALSTF